MFTPVDQKKKYSQMEQEVLDYWKKNHIFEKSVENRSEHDRYVFYDGPPFITGVPHHGTLLSSIIKDIVPRFWTMKGKRVERRWGWDCHGLPAENFVEKKLGIKDKRDVEKIGLEKYIQTCHEAMVQNSTEWEDTIDRIGRWVNFKGAYKTMDRDYMESVWWAFKTLFDMGKIYEGEKVLLYCPRCATPISKAEVAMDHSYQDVTDPSVFVRFALGTNNQQPTTDNTKTYLLAWTTTPWTLPANTAIAVSNAITYTTVKLKDNDNVYIVAKDIVERVFVDEKNKPLEYELLEDIEADDLIGQTYEPLFGSRGPNAHRILDASYVTTEEGTGIVHLAPAYGEEDFELAKEEDIPIYSNIDDNGIYTEGPWEGKHAWDVNKEIAKTLKEQGDVLRIDYVKHSYPHCHRCGTKLMYKAHPSWFMDIQGQKHLMIEENENIDWFPQHIKHRRFKNTVDQAPDWNLSRDRFWATPMPVWRGVDADGNVITHVIGSIEEIREELGFPNKLSIVRHGEAKNNTQGILDSSVESIIELTDKGITEIEKTAATLKSEKIDIILTSPLKRAKDSAEILQKELGVNIVVDERLREIDHGPFDGKLHKEMKEQFPTLNSKRKNVDEGMESIEALWERSKQFLDDMNEQYSGKNIVVVTHGDTALMLWGLMNGKPIEETLGSWYLKTGESYTSYAKPIDLHIPYIDRIEIEKDGVKLKRIDKVFDCWFESGSMPFAQFHYPFENKEHFELNFPGDFISEYVGQVRAWFYYLHAISVGIFGKNAFKNVIVTGTIAGNDGKKMSKSLGNFTDPNELIEQFSADALRFHLATSPLLSGEDFALVDKDVSDIHRKLGQLWNSYSFFVLYSNVDEWEKHVENIYDKEHYNALNILDKWILSRLEELNRDVNNGLESYNLPEAGKPILEFYDDLSNWYIRRSRKRFWKSEDDTDKDAAYHTLHHVLVKTSKIVAPFTPFIVDEIFRNLANNSSVHLEDYPTAEEKIIDQELNETMKKLRDLISSGLQLRATNKLKVRQPLQTLFVANAEFSEELTEIMKEELNVKDIEYASEVSDQESVKTATVGDVTIGLETELTKSLKQEGTARELIRAIQQMRKEAGYNVDDRISVGLVGGDDILDAHKELIAQEVLANKISPTVIENGDLNKELSVSDLAFTVSISKE